MPFLFHTYSISIPYRFHTLFLSYSSANPQLFLSQSSTIPQLFLSYSSAIPQLFLSQSSAIAQLLLSNSSADPQLFLSQFSAIPQQFIRYSSAIPQQLLSYSSTIPQLFLKLPGMVNFVEKVVVALGTLTKDTKFQQYDFGVRVITSLCTVCDTCAHKWYQNCEKALFCKSIHWLCTNRYVNKPKNINLVKGILAFGIKNHVFDKGITPFHKQAYQKTSNFIGHSDILCVSLQKYWFW